MPQNTLPTPSFLTLLFSSAIPAMVALFAVWLTSRLATIRAHDDKVWDRKADAYAGIFEALHALDTFFDMQLDDYFRHRERPEPETLALHETYRASRGRLEITVAREVWLLPSTVKVEMDALRVALDTRTDSWFDDMDSGAGAVGTATRNLSKIAEEDLRRPALFG